MSRVAKEVHELPASEWLHAACLFLVFVLALYLRIGGIPHAEPLMMHPDEPEFVVRALRIAARGDLNPHWFAHPGTLTLYNLALVYALQANLQAAPLGEILSTYGHDPAPFHVLGKYVIVFWSMVAHFGLWLLARQFVSRWFALLAVLLLATASVDITVATLIRTDTMQSAILVFSCLFLVRATTTGRLQWFLLAGAGLGFASAVKWPSVVACLAIAAAVFLAPAPRGRIRSPRRFAFLLSAAALASLAALFVASPYVFFDFGTVLDNVAHEARERDLGAKNVGLFPALGYYFRILLSSSSIPAFVLALLGILAALGSSRPALSRLGLPRPETWRSELVLVVFFVSYLVFMSLQSIHWPRWVVPLLPCFCLFSALASARSLQFARSRFGSRSWSMAVAAALALLLAVPVSASVHQRLKTLAETDPGVLATHWMARHAPKGARVLTERSAAYLPGKMFDIYIVGRRGRLERASQPARYYVPVGQVGYLSDAKAALESVDYVLLGGYQGKIEKQSKGHVRELRVYREILKGSKTVLKAGSYRILQVKKRPKAAESGEGER